MKPSSNRSTPTSTSSRSFLVSPRLLIWTIFALSVGTATVNYTMYFRAATAAAAATTSSITGSGSSSSSISIRLVNATLPARATPSQQQQQQQRRQAKIKKGRSRTLVGIISSDSFNDCTYRKRHRELFDIWNDTRLCSLDSITDACQVAYTFIIGAGNESAPTQLVSTSSTTTSSSTTTTTTSTWPLLVDKPLPNWQHEDINYPDTTLLNIRENMNEGKSESFLYFASIMMKKYNMEYAMKLDADSILHLHDYLAFSDDHLPSSSRSSLQHNNVFAGALRNKYHWPKLDTQEVYNRKEEYWQQEMDSVHLYLAGQCYIIGLDLVQWIVQEAPRNLLYKEGHEDHDISAMALKCPRPVTLITISKTQRFWEHPVKGQPRWDRIVKRETARMKQELFEGKKLRLY